jgi:hypothetical protein
LAPDDTTRPTPRGRNPFARQVWQKLRKRSFQRNLSYALGRFHAVRLAYAHWRGLDQRFRRAPSLGASSGASVEPFDVAAAVRGLRSDAVFRPVTLSAKAVADLRELAQSGVCVNWGDERRYRAAEVRAGRLPDGTRAIIGEIAEAPSHPAVRDISEDPRVLGAVARYLGYVPAQRIVRLLWSFASDASLAERRAAGQTFLFHFDVQSYNFLYANFYLTDVDATSGAHVMIAGSHRRKPIGWLLQSANRGDDEIHRYYGPGELVIAGRAGEGFLQDSSCYHKALVPQTADRLMLQIRYC